MPRDPGASSSAKGLVDVVAWPKSARVPVPVHLLDIILAIPMALLVGVRLGSYEILDLIGVGGMGEVYRARDPRLQRDVAIKILPSRVAADPDRLARFTREAHVLASLNHPNIASIYGFEDADGTQALILELVDGPTLDDRLAQGPLPLEEALPIATQIADALDAAHQRGIIHRDLKPSNIKVRTDGTVKVLDFGLAKALATDGMSPAASDSPTITSPALTRLGVILGTAAYMSPEQARGREVDKRTDIWSFGCVLYEMLAGKRAFDGTDVPDLLARVVTSDPDWSALPTEAPLSLRRVLRRCLEKDPRKRIRDIADVRFEIEEPVAQGAAASGGAPTSTRRVRKPAAWALAGVLLVSLAGLLLVSLAGLSRYVALRPPPDKEVTRFQVYAPPDMVLGAGAAGLSGPSGAASGTVSPDGTRLVFVATDRAGQSRLWLRAFDTFDAVPLIGTEGASLPFWAPDGRAIAFFMGHTLQRIDAAGGPPETICDVAGGFGDLLRGATWGSGGDILFNSGYGGSSRLYRVSAHGGTPAPLPMPTNAEVPVEALWPYFLPDGRSFLYWARDTGGGAAVYAASIVPGTAPKRLLASSSRAAYDPSGFLLFTTDGVLLRQRFDPVRLEVSGEPMRVVDGLASGEVYGQRVAAFSISNTGVLAYQQGVGQATQFAWFDRTGRLLEAVGNPGAYLYPSLSPDGKRLLYSNASDGHLWIFDINRKIASKFTTGPGPNLSPVWSPDGRTIIYRKGTVGSFFQKRVSDAAEENLVIRGAFSGPSQISPDGKWLLYSSVPDGESAFAIFLLPMTGDRKPQRLVQSPFADVEPQLSPDGSFLAYASSATGRYEVYVQPFPATGERWQVSNTGGHQPLWRQDGKELFFVNDERKFYAVAITPRPTFDYSPPQFLFEMRANVYAVRNSYFPSGNGQRFLVNMALDTAAPPIRVIRNWTAGLKD